ncbi:TPA: DNA-3-methyladenine glycosylase [Candidatus Nomurabacteria bacterium]|nr:DNA-3-methyladenine glycosylase [Candidatus Nomurabacteria bacterium]
MKLTHPYCNYVSNLKDVNDVDKIYHDNHYGVRIEDDNELFGRLIMEINQAGLSWRTILMKEKGFRNAYNNFDIKKIAKYGEKDFLRLMNDAKIIRNKLKINAVIYNAQEIIKIQKEFGSFRKFLDFYVKENKNDKNLWLKLFKKHFKFVGGEIVGEFLLSIDMLPGTHDTKCKVIRK